MRTLILIGALAAIGGLAFLVARPAATPLAATPYVGKRGGSRATSSGLGLSFRRDGEVQPLAPGTRVRAGDMLRFSVRAEVPRYLLVRMRDGAATSATIFPAPPATEAVLVEPGEALPVAPTLGPGAGKVVVTAVFGDRAFSLEGARAVENEEIDLVLEKE